MAYTLDSSRSKVIIGSPTNNKGKALDLMALLSKTGSNIYVPQVASTCEDMAMMSMENHDSRYNQPAINPKVIPPSSSFIGTVPSTLDSRLNINKS